MTDLQKAGTRDRIQPAGAEQLNAALILDERRRRPFWFDGRFLAARDLTREQDYFLTRQADIGRINGAGIASGLMVEARPGNALRITAGYGATPSGDLVAVPKAIDVDLTDIAAGQGLDATFGLSPIPRDPAINRTGLFVLALRPVEFSANPITSYPKTLTETRSAQDGDIVEAVAITLIPYPDSGSAKERAGQRGRAARDIFLRRSAQSAPANALPVAMISLVNGALQWLDVFMVRREIGAGDTGTLSLGFSPRALREAHFQQYTANLHDILAERARTLRPANFAASEHFLVLPPAGPMPPAAIDPLNLTQSFFPPSVDVEVSLLPDDELQVMLEESMLLPPIDLSLSAAEQESTAVLILLPLSRSRIAKVQAGLVEKPIPGAVLQPGPPSSRKPAQSLEVLLRAQVERAALPLLRPEIRVPDEWRALLNETPLFYYVRRRNFTYKEGLAGIRMPAVLNDVEQETQFNKTVTDAGLTDRLKAMRVRATTFAAAQIFATLSQPKILSSPALLETAVKMFEDVPELSQKTARIVAARLSDPKLGQGIERIDALVPVPDGALEAAAPAQSLRNALVGLPNLVELDALIRSTPEKDLPALAERLSTAAGDPDELRKVAAQMLEGSRK